MKAIICPKYGPPEVLKQVDVPIPEPKVNEVRIKIHATAVTASDLFIRGSELPFLIKTVMRLSLGWRRPRKSIIGLVLSGTIDSIGEGITRFKVGDEVYGLTGYSLGAYAEYKCLKESDSMQGSLAIKPKNISHEEATVAAYGGLLALQYLEKGNYQKAEKVIIYGASGTTGTTAIQLAKSAGAKVTAICRTRNFDLVKELGADEVIDYTVSNRLPIGEQYDLVLDAVGKMKTSLLKEACKKALNGHGKYVSIDDGALKLNSERLNKIRALVEGNKFKPIIDRVYAFDQIVEAHKYVEQGHKVGGVAINLNEIRSD